MRYCVSTLLLCLMMVGVAIAASSGYVTKVMYQPGGCFYQESTNQHNLGCNMAQSYEINSNATLMLFSRDCASAGPTESIYCDACTKNRSAEALSTGAAATSHYKFTQCGSSAAKFLDGCNADCSVCNHTTVVHPLACSRHAGGSRPVFWWASIPDQQVVVEKYFDSVNCTTGTMVKQNDYTCGTCYGDFEWICDP